jgi:inorganic phosphate transporter, PiT family
VSGSHSLVGGIVGAALAVKGAGVLQWAGIEKVLIGLVASPLCGFLVGYIMLVTVYWVAYRMTPRTVRRVFGVLQIGSSGFMAFTHGMNDAQKVMGIITMALIGAGYWTPTPYRLVPLWVMIACAIAMGVGTVAGGWKVIRTLGMRLAHIRPIEGCAAETAAGVVLSVAAHIGMPVSTTHTITGAILGVGSAYKAKTVRWGIGAKILSAWVLTLPVGVLLGAIFASILVRYC